MTPDDLRQIASHVALSSTPGLAAIARHYLNFPATVELIRAEERRRIGDRLRVVVSRPVEGVEVVAAVSRLADELLSHLPFESDSVASPGTRLAKEWRPGDGANGCDDMRPTVVGYGVSTRFNLPNTASADALILWGRTGCRSRRREGDLFTRRLTDCWRSRRVGHVLPL